jgi:hypothetical protein
LHANQTTQCGGAERVQLGTIDGGHLRCAECVRWNRGQHSKLSRHTGEEGIALKLLNGIEVFLALHQ